MNNVYPIAGSLYWGQTPAAKRTHALKAKWDSLPDRQREHLEENPGLWSSLCHTPEEREEIHAIHERILFGEDVNESEKRALLCRLDHLDPEQTVKRRFDENGERIKVDHWWSRPTDPTA